MPNLTGTLKRNCSGLSKIAFMAINTMYPNKSIYRKRGFTCSYTQQCWYMATAKINNLKFQIYKSFPNFTCSLEILDTIIISIIYLDALTSQRNNTTWYTTLKYFFGYRIQGVKKSFYRQCIKFWNDVLHAEFTCSGCVIRNSSRWIVNIIQLPFNKCRLIRFIALSNTPW